MLIYPRTGVFMVSRVIKAQKQSVVPRGLINGVVQLTGVPPTAAPPPKFFTVLTDFLSNTNGLKMFWIVGLALGLHVEALVFEVDFVVEFVDEVVEHFGVYIAQ